MYRPPALEILEKKYVNKGVLSSALFSMRGLEVRVYKKFKKVSSTLETCYCVDGVLKIIKELNPDLILNHTC